MLDSDLLSAGEVGDCAGYFEDSIVGASGKPKMIIKEATWASLRCLFPISNSTLRNPFQRHILPNF